MIFTDTHTHLYAAEFDTDRTDMVNRAVNDGIEKLFLPNIDSSSIAGMLALCKQFPNNCFPMMGLHPCSVKDGYEKELQVVEQYLEAPPDPSADSRQALPEEKEHEVIKKKRVKFYGVGEIGLDLYWDKTFIEEQIDAFSWQILLAKKYELPIIIHTRNAFNEAYEIVKRLHDNKLKGIFHCFSGTIEEAKKVMELETFKLGIGGVLTFKNSGLDKVVKEISLEYLVLETDSPYLAPMPHRGKRNESAYTKIIAQKMLEVTGKTIEEIAEVTTRNAKQIFRI